MNATAPEHAADTAASSDRTAGDAWFVRLGAERHGPMPIAQVRQRFEAGLYSRWHEGSSDGRSWTPIRGLLNDLEDAFPEDLTPAAVAPGEQTGTGAFDWSQLVSETDHRASPIQQTKPAASWHTARVAEASMGGLLLALGLLPIVADGSRATGWWGWPSGQTGWPFALMSGLWMTVGLVMLMFSVTPKFNAKAYAPRGTAWFAAIWLTGWLAAGGGPALLLVAPAWLVVLAGYEAHVRFPLHRAALWTTGGLLLVLSTTVTGFMESLSATVATFWWAVGLTVIGYGFCIHPSRTASRKFKLLVGAVGVLALLFATGITAHQGAQSLRPTEPVQAGAQYVRVAVFVTAMLGLVGMRWVNRANIQNLRKSNGVIVTHADPEMTASISTVPYAETPR